MVLQGLRKKASKGLSSAKEGVTSGIEATKERSSAAKTKAIEGGRSLRSIKLKDTIDGDKVRFLKDLSNIGILKNDIGTIVVDVTEKPRGRGTVRSFSAKFEDVPEPVSLAGLKSIAVLLVTPSPRRAEMKAITRQRSKETQANVEKKVTGAIKTGRSLVKDSSAAFDVLFGGGSGNAKRKRPARRKSPAQTKGPVRRISQPKFLNKWFEISPNTYNKAFDDNDGIGAIMMEQLRNNSPSIFSKISRNL